MAGLKKGKEDNYKVIAEMREEYDKRRRFMLDSFNEMGLECFEPKGAFYIFPCVKNIGMTGDEFAKRLLMEKEVAVVPGSAFGKFGTYYIRCSYAYSMKSLMLAMDKIREFVLELKK